MTRSLEFPPGYAGLWPGTASRRNPFSPKWLLSTKLITATGREMEAVLPFCAAIYFPSAIVFPGLKPSRFCVMCQRLLRAGGYRGRRVGMASAMQRRRIWSDSDQNQGRGSYVLFSFLSYIYLWSVCRSDDSVQDPALLPLCRS